MAATHYPIVLESELNGTVSAYVVGVPGVFAAADTEAQAARGIRNALAAHLDLLRELGQALPVPRAQIRVLKLTHSAESGRTGLMYVGTGALLGRRTSAAKAAAARRNGRKGGRPRKNAARTRS